MQRELATLAARQIISRVVSVKGDGIASGDLGEAELLAALQLAHGCEQRGAAAEPDVSELLARAQFGLSAQDELGAPRNPAA